MTKKLCEVKLIDQKNTKELMQMLGFTGTIERMVRAAAVRWYGNVLQREEGNILKEALIFEVNGRRKRRDNMLHGKKLD